MRVIDLLVKIANGEEVPKKILYKKTYYDFSDGDYFNQERFEWLFAEHDITKILNDDVEIIEDNSIINLVNYAGFEAFTNEVKFDYLYEMITRIIDKINEMEEK